MQHQRTAGAPSRAVPFNDVSTDGAAPWRPSRSHVVSTVLVCRLLVLAAVVTGSQLSSSGQTGGLALAWVLLYASCTIFSLLRQVSLR